MEFDRVLILRGKSQGNGGGYKLLAHLLDTAAVSSALWGHWLRERAHAALCEKLGLGNAQAAQNLLAYWAALHDLGKASPSFQLRLAHGDAVFLENLQHAGFAMEERGFTARADVPHNFITLKVLPELMATRFGYDKEVAGALATALAGHHGFFPQAGDIANLRPVDVGRGAWEEARAFIARKLADVLNVPPGWHPAEALARDNALLMVVAGITSVADWLASAARVFVGRADAPALINEDDLAPYINWAQERARDLITGTLRWGIGETPAPGGFGEVCFAAPPAELFPIQSRTEGLNLNGPALVIIEAPMGEGKTEAALYLADRWLGAGAQGIYFALPTMATADQMYGRVRTFLERRLGEEVTTRLVHSMAPLREDFPPDVAPRTDGDDADDLLAREWFTNKKGAFLWNFGVGTIDQALLGALSVKHVFVRLLGMAHKVLIVDEVHAYDVYMSTLLTRLVEWLAALGAPVVMLSATLPRAKREALVRAYAGAAPALPDGNAYPQITVATLGGGIEAIGCEAAPGRAREVRLVKKSRPAWTDEDFAALARELAETLRDGGCAAVICNTVDRAQKMYLALREHFRPREELGLLHARFPYSWRQEREECLTKMFGKEAGARPRKFVLVGTQVLEQSLDLDFDLMVSDLAPADLVLQRMGRLHRHDRPRPPHLQKPALWLLWPEGGNELPPQIDEGTAAVYDRYVLLRSWLALARREVVALPGDVAAIVEEVYDQANDPGGANPFADALNEAREAFEHRVDKLAAHGQIGAIPSPAAANFFFNMERELADEEDLRYGWTIRAVTRWEEGPSVTAVCLVRDPAGNITTVTGDHVDLEVPAGRCVAASLLRSAVRLSGLGIANEMMNLILNAEATPASWRGTPQLRFAFPLIFEEGEGRAAVIGNYRVRLDAELGIIVDRNQ